MTNVNGACADENSENIASVDECMDAISQIRHLDKRAYFDKQSGSDVYTDGWCSVSGGLKAKKITWNSLESSSRISGSHAICIGKGEYVWLIRITTNFFLVLKYR